MGKICAFTGHRVVEKQEREQIEQKLYQTILKLYDNGVKIFRAGGAVGFDTMAARAVIKARREHSDIELHLVFPCLNQDKFFSEKQKKEYEEIAELADRKIVIQEEYTDGCMLKRNRYMIDGSSFCVCYLRRKRGGTFYTVNYAKEKGVPIIEL